MTFIIALLALLLVTPRAVDAPIGVVGCSNTVASVQGYETVGGQRFWDSTILKYGGGWWHAWTVPISKYWQSFDNGLVQNPSTVNVWLQLCPDARRDPILTDQDRADGLTILNLVRQRIPNAVVYVSAVNTFDEGWVCRAVGRAGVEVAEMLRDYLIGQGQVVRGPDMGPLGQSTTTSGGCHPNQAGKTLLGNQLLAFFGG